MPRGANRNVILSHGGKHGRAAGTYLQNRVVPASAAPHVPERLLREVKAPGKQEGEVAGAKKAPAVQTPAKAEPKAKVPVNVPKHRVVETPKPEPKPTPEPKVEKKVEPAPEPTPAPEPVAEEPQAQEVEIPTSKRQLQRVNKADCYVLAVELGLDVPANPEDITSKELKSLLAKELGL